MPNSYKMINKEILKTHYPIININKQWQKVYNPNFDNYFDTLKPQNYLDLAQKLAQRKSILFRHIYLESAPKQYTDIMQNWALSCAVFVSQVLLYFWYIKKSNAKVTSLEKNLSNSWRKKVAFKQDKDSIKLIPKGAILIRANLYKRKQTNKINNKSEFFISDYHIGFYNWNQKAISNVVTKNKKNIKAIAEHNAIRDAPKLDHYDKIEIVHYYIPNF